MTVAPVVRRVRFVHPDDLDPVWTPNLPEVAYAANGISLLMPHVEPWVARVVRDAIPDLDDPALAERARVYVVQETQHHREHHRFNRLLIERYPRLARADGWTARWVGFLQRRRGTFGLAFAAAFESLAYAAARWTDAHHRTFFHGAHPTPTRLFLWHLAEEVEHKSVAVDVYRARGGTRRTYAMALVAALLVLAVRGLAPTIAMLRADRRLRRPTTWWRLVRWATSFVFEALPTALVSMSRRHHPEDLADPPYFATWLRGLTVDPGDAGPGAPIDEVPAPAA